MSPPFKRPLGVMVASLILGLLGLGSVLCAILMALAAANMGAMPGRPPVSPEAVARIVFLAAVAFTLIAIWAGATVAGLVQMKSWARYSILLIGGSLTLLGIFSVAGMATGLAAMPAAVPSSTTSAPLDAHTMQIAFLFVGLFYSALAGIGVWWLIYFNLRATRSAFQALSPATDDNPAYRSRTLTGSSTPFSIVVIAGIFLLSAVSCVVCGCLPIPGFVFGFVVRGAAQHILYAVLAVVTGAIGVGLFRLRNQARLATIGVIAIGTVNLAITPTPWYRAALARYTHDLNQQFGLPQTTAITDPHMQPILLLSVILGLVLYGIILAILHRHRHLFR